MQRRTLLSALAAAGASTAAPWASAQADYPNQLIRWVVPYPAGGGTDVLARTVAEAMRQTLGQQIVVDNRPGASTNIGGQAVATAKADGYTIMSADNAILAYNEHLFSKLPFSPQNDFTYVGGISRFPLALVVHPSFEAKTMKEFLAYVRANPGKVNYASPGNGSPHHLAMEMFKNRTKTFLTHIPYRGAAPAMADVMGGQVPCMFLDLASGLSVIQSGKVRALAIGSAKRIATLPDVPTLGEVGVADTEVFAFQGILGPKGLPANVTQRLNADLNKALASPAVVKRMQDFGMEALPGTPEQFRALARAEAKRWGEVIKAAGVKLD
ncbi:MULTISPECIES: Bug family tripartite tricarboxylate transporter substrate binding protein [Simplicispira]|uniref:Tripartite-type tricarboxylate transporter receptor subunit TctC n=1 Tax=Simplicispira metamorpha TaxID=80881 RepID=A0A4R2N6K6_9BURK|nr:MULTISPECIES: tripartite tricarboxylate transporter substrate binding protein [Simplicispira]MBP7414349.1 tripartite tricarboxylate transporter substrate binding protein [Giesbergeria sp.]MBP8204704.1 tripartite tricarboxylate transporter substrate binding protein [Giesbergeria sp.]MDD2691701.1 tripartite tricarboxylate transporter substrate binding protein [Simplicispira sp.]TCP16458.1 tripartite-type tricarboxylate transporter receptor subunit TctC [Simplicispira metamorpha]